MYRILRFEALEVRRLLALSPVGGEFKANTTLDAAQTTPVVAADAAGNFAVAWTQSTQSDDMVDVFVRRFSAGGAPLSPEVRVNSTLAGFQESPGIAMEDGGEFVVVWRGPPSVGPFSESVFAQRYSAAGVALGDEILVSHTNGNFFIQPVVAMDALGGFVVAWQADGDGEGREILARRYLNDGAPAGDAFQVNNLITAGDQEEPAIGMNSGGEFVIAWHGFGNDADRFGVSARRFNASAAPQGDEFQVNVTTALDQRSPAVAVGEDGRFVVVWDALGEIVGELNVIGRRFDPLGAALGGEFMANTTTNQAWLPEVAMGPDGNFLVAWQSIDFDDGVDSIAAREFSADGVPVGMEIQVNTITNVTEEEPAIAFDGLGNAVVVWQGSELGPEFVEIYGQRYTASGCSPRFDEFRANTTQANDQSFPQVAVDPDGDFVIVWQGQDQDGSSYGVYGQRYEAGGCPAGLEFQVNTTTAGFQAGADVATDASGGFVVVWTSQDQDGSEAGVYGRVYSALGVPLTGEIQINTTTFGTQYVPAVARQADGDFVVVWIGPDGDLESDLEGVFGRRFAADGTPRGDEFRVNTVTAGTQFSADVAIDADGDFVVVWQSGDGDDYGIFGRRYNAAGEPQGGEFRINTFTAGEQLEPAVSMDAAGKFVVAWTSIGQDGDQGGIYAQRFDAAGNKLGGEFTAPQTSGGDQSAPAVSLDADGDFVIAWSSVNELTTAILARGFTPLGKAKGGEFEVTGSFVPNGDSSVSLDADGDFVVAWHRGGYLAHGDEDGYGIYARRFAAIPRPPAPLLPLTPVGAEFMVNTTSDPALPVVAADAAGNYAVAWRQFTPAFDTEDVYVRRFSADGLPRGAEVLVNTTRPSMPSNPAIAMEDGGDFVVVWDDDARGTDGKILAQRFSAAGDPLGDEIAVSSMDEPDFPVVAMDDSGGFVVVWESVAYPFSGVHIVARRYRNDGIPAGDAFQVGDTDGRSFQKGPAIGMTAGGEFVIAWQSQDESDRFNTLARRFDATATPKGDAFQVGADSFPSHFVTGGNRTPALAVGDDGRFVVVWEAATDFLLRTDVIARRFDSLGAALGGEFRVDTTGVGIPDRPEIAMGPGGSFLFAWTNGETIFAREFEADGAPIGVEFQVNNTGNLFATPAVAFDGLDNAVIVWNNRGSPATIEDDEIVGRRLARIVCGPRFDDFRANTTTANDQSFPQVASNPDGDFVIVWQSLDQDRSGFGVYGQRFAADGCPTGGEFQVNMTTAGFQYVPDVAIDPSGSFVVVWTSENQDGAELGVVGRVYSAVGVSLGGEIRINTTTAGSQTFPAVARRADGGFVVVWQSLGQDGDGFGAFGRRFDAAGAPLGGEFLVNTVTAGQQGMADVAIDPDGNFVVVWEGNGADGDSYGIFGRRYTASGAPLSGEFRINTFTAGEQRDPAVSLDAAGNFIVTWSSIGQDGDQGGIYAQRFDAAGNRLGGEFAAHQTTGGDQLSPAVSLDADGDFVITWTSAGDSASPILARGFTSLGQAKGDEFSVFSPFLREGGSSVALDADGDFIVARHRTNVVGDGEGYGIFARQFAAIPPPVLVTQSTTGLYDSSTATFFLRNSNSQGVADLAFNYGAISLTTSAVIGDFNGDGLDTIGLYNSTGGVFFLKDGNSSGAADHAIQFGPADNLLDGFAGDWDGDGDDTVGFYNPETGVFFLRNEHAGGAADVTVQFGPPDGGYLSLVGDWDGDGIDTIGLYDGSTGTFFLKNTNTAGAADLAYHYGPIDAEHLTPLVGDWDADGDDTLGLYRIPDSVFFLRNEHSPGFAHIAYNFGPNNTGFQPLAGDWNGPSSPALRLAVPAVRGGSAPSITIAEARPLLDEARARWAAAGVDLIGARRVGGVSPLFPDFPLFPRPTLRIADLAGNLLGLAIGNEIVIDHNAAGRGWFVDPTPTDDVEFAPDNGRLLALDSVLAGDQLDLLTVIAHELGHLMGLDHAADGDLMSATLGPGERRIDGRK